MSAASAAERVMGPTWAMVPKAPAGNCGTRPNVGFRPNTPVNADGTRMEPPPSVPRDSGPMPAATAAVAPPQLPPGVRSGFQGLRVMPVSGLSVTVFQWNSEVFVFPRRTAPCSRRRATGGASTSHGPVSEVSVEPQRVDHPAVSRTSFTDVGTPSTSPRGSPRRQRSSDSLAAARARSGSIRRKAFRRSFSAEIRDSTAPVASTGEHAFVR